MNNEHPKPLRWYDTITMNIYYLAITLRSQTLTPDHAFAGTTVCRRGDQRQQLRHHSLVSLMVPCWFGAPPSTPVLANDGLSRR